MGCYIHTVLEVVGPDEYVEDFATLNLSQDYAMFSLMAGVRSEISAIPVSEPKGLPEKVSRTVEEESKKPNLHSHSWLTLAELKRVQKRITKLIGYEHWELAIIIAMMEKIHCRRWKSRLVFWFDG